MKKRKEFISVILIVCILFCLCSCGKPKEKGDAVIVFTNDVHSAIANTVKKDDGTLLPGLSYGTVASLKKTLESEGKNVFLVDSGDFVQGSAYGAFDEGNSIIEIMHKTGYDVVSFGNHEFDYGQLKALSILSDDVMPFVSCNFYHIDENGDTSLVLPPYKVIEKNGVKIAFVGISTPETASKSSPDYFQDAGGNPVYSFFAGEENAETLYVAVQGAIDAAKKEADYVIALGHLGTDVSSAPYRSEDVIANTAGLDALIDGHSHTKTDGKTVADKNGNSVLLCQTEGYFKAIGQITISGGELSYTCITESGEKDPQIEDLEKKLIADVDAKFGEVIAKSAVDFYISSPEESKRLVRRQETNLGDFTTDSFYYYFNEVENLDCDAAILNGGAIRSDIPAGDFSYKTCQTISPFGNVICMVALSGRELLDTLEFGARNVGLTVDGQSAENGGFFQAAGLRFSIDSAIESTVSVDPNGVWLSGPTGEYKVKDVKVYNKKTGIYEDLDLDKTYTVCGINYILRNSGDGNVQLSDTELVKDYVGEDYYIMALYCKSFAKGEDGLPLITTAGSPLSRYPGYLLDYDNPLGSGRITIE